MTLDNDVGGDKPTRALQVLSVKPCIDENTEIRFLHDGGWRVDTITEEKNRSHSMVGTLWIDSIARFDLFLLLKIIKERIEI
jgi:hypothetical protein